MNLRKASYCPFKSSLLNMTVEEIADLEGVSLQTVAQSISNAIKRIRRRFRKAGYDVANV